MQRGDEIPHGARFWTPHAVKFLKSRFINKRKRRNALSNKCRAKTAIHKGMRPRYPFWRALLCRLKYIHPSTFFFNHHLSCFQGHGDIWGQSRGTPWTNRRFITGHRQHMPRLSVHCKWMTLGFEWNRAKTTSSRQSQSLVPKCFQLICCESTRRPKYLEFHAKFRSQCLPSDAKIPYSLVSIASAAAAWRGRDENLLDFTYA